MGIVRLLLALAVVASHSSPIFGLRMIDGKIAVELFFVISGFYMSLVLGGKYSYQQHAKFLFYGSRFLRLYPAYLLCLLLTWCVFSGQYFLLGHPPTNGWMIFYQSMSWHEKLPLIFSNWFLIGLDVPFSAYYKLGHGFDWLYTPNAQSVNEGLVFGGDFATIPQAWSVGSEIWFYLLAPFLLRKKWHVLVVVIIASVSIKFYLEHCRHCISYFFFPAQLCYFVIGALLHRCYVKSSSVDDFAKFGSSAIFIVVTGIFVCDYFPPQMMKYVLYPIFFVCLPAIFSSSKASSWDRHIGNLSYPVYIFHLLAKNVLQTAFKISDGTILALTTVIVAIIVYVWVEIPIDAYRQTVILRFSCTSRILFRNTNESSLS